MVKKSKYNIAIVGATGAVGETFLRVLLERKFPIDNLTLLASEKSVGKSIAFDGRDYRVELLSPESFKGVDIALFSAGGKRSEEFAPYAVKAGTVVVDNSSAFRMETSVPLVIPEINPQDAEKHSGIIANPNCTTIIMLVAVKPLHDYAGVKRIVVSTYQSTSGAGSKAMAELISQTREWAAEQPVTTSVFPHQILFNVIPQVDVFTDNGYTKEEMKMVNETKKIMGDDSIKVSATCVRVPVLSAHSEAITIETERKITADKARELLASAPGVKVLDYPERDVYPMPLTTAGQDICYVGRIREDISAKNSLVFWVSGDQLRKGAATNAVQIAELLIK